MSWLRRRHETLNEELLREAGYSPDGTATGAVTTGDPREPEPEPQPDPPSRSAADASDALGLRSAGDLGSSEPHVVVTTEAPELTGASYTFTTLPDGSLIVDDSCTEDLSRLADAVEEHVEPPYRAAASRHDDGLWAVLARPIEVARLAADGDELELTSMAGERSYTIDGRSVDAGLAPAGLAAFGEARSDDYAVHAVRLDGDLWEIEADPL